MSYNDDVTVTYLGAIPKTYFDQVLKPALWGSRKTVPLQYDQAGEWWLARSEGQIVGCACLLPMGSKARLKSAIVHKDFRGKGIYDRLFAARLEFIQNDGRFSSADAFCSPMILTTLLRYGFVANGKRFGGASTYVTKVL